ncbi:MAG: hypothetical protein ACD_57C00117G0005, partial [uncultured bacterium]
PASSVQTPIEQDFSEYIPLVVSIIPSTDTCTDNFNEITYHTGEHLKLLGLKSPDIADFQISVENDEALFSRKGSQYVGAVEEGDLFGVLNDAKGRGAQAIGKLVEVGSDYIKIAPVINCKTQPLT